MNGMSEYDFIVVGGGTSGLVLAARLTEDPHVEVLVVEAGEDHLQDPRISVPALWPSLLGSEADWSFATQPQTALYDRVISHPQGRALGGSSGLNAQAFIAPSEAGINFWRDLGNPGWGWDTMSSYYQKSHILLVPPADVCAHLGLKYLMEGKYREDSGPIQISYTGTMADSLSKAWVDTFRALNYGLSGDPFAGGSMGGFANPTTVNSATKERSYSASAYFAPVRDRANLHLVTNSHVKAINFEHEAGVAMASSISLLTSEGASQELKARREIILAAGAFNSSKILELSGIGNPAILEPLGIDVVVYNPNVGENLQDHPMTGISFEVKPSVTTLDDLNRQDPAAISAAMQAYETAKTGPFSGGAINSFAFMPVVEFQSEAGQAELQRLLHTYPQATTNQDQASEYSFVRNVLQSFDQSSVAYFMYAAQGNFGANGSKAKDVTMALEPGNFITVAASLSYPLSRGSSHISSTDPTAKPKIDPRYLSHPLDLEIMARHLLFVEKIVSTEPLASMLKPDGKRRPASTYLNGDLEKAKEYLKRTMIPGWHPAGTCAMKPLEKGGVVDERLVVHGTRFLRVVDASVMPLVSRGNLQSTVYAVTERAADLVKEDWGLRP
ncbi:MAG: hypothetical protein Q9190_000418 [Brigantiaea leucoxantha]